MPTDQDVGTTPSAQKRNDSQDMIKKEKPYYTQTLIIMNYKLWNGKALLRMLKQKKIQNFMTRTNKSEQHYKQEARSTKQQQKERDKGAILLW
jgi:hypothetical protein